MRLKYVAVSLLCLSLCLSATACKEKEKIATKKVSSTSVSSEKTKAPAAPVDTTSAETVDTTSAEPAETADGVTDGEVGSAADYVGLYELTGSDDDFPFNIIEIHENDREDMYVYLYNDDAFVAEGDLDYSEQRALNGNALMEISVDIDGSDVDIEIFPFSTESTSELEMEFNGISGLFEKTDGTMLLFDKNEASDYLFDFLGAKGYSLDGTAIISDVDRESLGLEAWFFAWGKNDIEKFTAEKRFAVTSLRQVWEYDVLSDEWTISTISE
jgi:hypothetical protein